MHPWIDLALVALLPLTALLTVIQARPMFALVSRGILGAVAVLLYAVLGAPDVALTEALVGTLLTVILYAVAVRSSMVIRLGVLTPQDDGYDISGLQRFCARHDLSLRRRSFEDAALLMLTLQMGGLDVVHAPARSVRDYVPALADLDDDRRVTLVARHGRWHEKHLRRWFRESEVVMRLGPPANREAS
jgi:uncharacterized MnhB-related membrane protein